MLLGTYLPKCIKTHLAACCLGPRRGFSGTRKCRRVCKLIGSRVQRFPLSPCGGPAGLGFQTRSTPSKTTLTHCQKRSKNSTKLENAPEVSADLQARVQRFPGSLRAEVQPHADPRPRCPRRRLLPVHLRGEAQGAAEPTTVRGGRKRPGRRRGCESSEYCTFAVSNVAWISVCCSRKFRHHLH